MSRPGEASVCECVCTPVTEVCFQCALLVFPQCVPAHVCIEHGIGGYRGRLHPKDPQTGNEKRELLVLRAPSPASAFYKSHNLSELQFTTCVMGEHDTRRGFCQS